MKDIIKVIMISIAIGLVVGFEFMLGYYNGLEDGKKDVIDNMLVTNEEKEEGMYVVKYNDKTYYYWYE